MIGLEANSHSQTNHTIARRSTSRSEEELVRSRRRLQEKRRRHVSHRHTFIRAVENIRRIQREVDRVRSLDRRLGWRLLIAASRRRRAWPTGRRCFRLDRATEFERLAEADIQRKITRPTSKVARNDRLSRRRCRIESTERRDHHSRLVQICRKRRTLAE